MLKKPYKVKGVVNVVRITINIETGTQVEAEREQRNDSNVLRFGPASLPRGTTARATGIKLPMGVQVLHIELQGTLKPEEVKPLAKYAIERYKAMLNEFGRPKVLVLSGKGPIWMFGVLIHTLLHITPAIATFDPKLGGGVIIADHSGKFEEGEVIELPVETISEIISG